MTEMIKDPALNTPKKEMKKLKNLTIEKKNYDSLSKTEKLELVLLKMNIILNKSPLKYTATYDYVLNKAIENLEKALFANSNKKISKFGERLQLKEGSTSEDEEEIDIDNNPYLKEILVLPGNKKYNELIYYLQNELEESRITEEAYSSGSSSSEEYDCPEGFNKENIVSKRNIQTNFFHMKCKISLEIEKLKIKSDFNLENGTKFKSEFKKSRKSLLVDNKHVQQFKEDEFKDEKTNEVNSKKRFSVFSSSLPNKFSMIYEPLNSNENELREVFNIENKKKEEDEKSKFFRSSLFKN